jgi:RimJ/RimL family protein N-acetyltransferase
MDPKFESVKDLPFADHQFKAVVTEPIIFNLQKDNRAVTLFPVNDAKEVPELLKKVLHEEFLYVVEEGRTYPHHKTYSYDEFVEYWFHHFVAILVDGEHHSWAEESYEYWKDKFLGNFYVKPNYVGRCSHVCNGGFVVNHEKRGLGLGKEMGRKYLEVAPKLGYTYSVFNLVFETNVASLRIWDSLGFDRIGYVKKAAVLKGEDRYVGAIMYGKDL